MIRIVWHFGQNTQVALVEDEYPFILVHPILWDESDTDVAVPFVDKVRAAFPEFDKCSFDRGFYSLPIKVRSATSADRLVCA